MDIQNLQAFIAVFEQQSFSKASAILNLTQPAVSKRIAALEQDYGTSLFDRIGKHIILTQAGKILLPSARHIIEEIKRSHQSIQGLSGHLRGELKLATSHHIGLHRLPPVLRAFSSAHENVELDLHFMDSEQACEMIENGQLELAIVTLPRKASKNLVTQVIWHDPLVVVVGKTHALASMKNISTDDLIDRPAILPSHETFTRSMIEQQLSLSKMPPIALETNYLETIKMMVSIGLGWGVLPKSMIHGELIEFEIKGVNMSRELGAVYHRNRSLSSASLAMIDVLEKI
ncbi:MAG: LysR family transcriptional regulator [Gammaproteobacteria bacterium]|nr:LysR family transcriptional regulator [Gammaproteobacteria bacterium]